MTETPAPTTDQILAEAAATTPPMAAIYSPEVVSAVQEKLLERNYVDGGPVDGKLGDKLKDEILAVRRREGLPLTPTIDAEFLKKLETAAPKALPIEQVTATATEIAPKVEAVRKTRWAKFWAKVTAWPSLAVGSVLAVIERFDEAVEKIAPLKNMASEVPAYAWIAGVGVVATLLAIYLGKTESDMVEGYQKGTVKNDNKLAEDTEEES